MELLDPATGRSLPSDAIQRVLFLGSTVHVYNIPPLTSMRGHSAVTWTADPSRHIFTARLRVVETSFSSSLKVDVLLEDPSSAQFFAAAPYTDPTAVEPVIDSSRFFAVTVRDQDSRKAVLGIGFEERSDAFDLAVCLQEVRRSLGWQSEKQQSGSGSRSAEANETVKDYSLKEGETITVKLGKSALGRQRTTRKILRSEDDENATGPSSQPFVLPPPPPSGSGGRGGRGGEEGGAFALPPPPSAKDVRRKRRSMRDMGFDDGQFGEFA